MDKAYQEGRKANKNGKYRSDCPYKNGTKEWKQWRKGWYAEEIFIGHEVKMVVGDEK